MLTVAASQHAVNTKASVLLLDLARLDGGQSLDGAQTRVLCKGQGNGVQRISEGAHSVLLNTRALQKVEMISPMVVECSSDNERTLTAASSTAREQAISAAPPP